MTDKVINLIKDNEKIFFSIVILLFILIRLPGIHLPLHQDEYKWPIIVNPANGGESYIPHPPLSELIYRTAGNIVGFNVNFRLVPLFFGTLNLFLLYYLMKFLFGRKEAIVASAIWIFSYFSVLASLMVDTDGEILPFFFLSALIGYYKLLKSEGKQRYIWGGVLLLSCIMGFLVKVSFVLAIGSIIADFLWSKRKLITRKDLVKYSSYLVGVIVFLGGLLFVMKFIFPFFNLNQSITYWEHFFIGNRGWFQTIIQCVKAIFYASPFLVLTPFLFEKGWFEKVKSLIFFLIFSFLFYIVIFDFSIGALDRYLQLIILPLSVLSSIVIVKVLDKNDRRAKEFLLLGVFVSLVLVFAQSLPHYVPPLHPKSEWISRVLSLRWNFVYPFSGGSGPLGFYVSFLFIALSWVITFISVIIAWAKPNYKKLVIVFLIPIGLAYNGVFIEEYLLGYWNGYAPGLMNSAVEFIKNNDDIKMVTTYNDNGGNEIQEIGKYRKRLYVDPKFDVNEKILTLNKYKEHYFVLNVPRLDPTSIYQKYFDSCKPIYNKIDKKMSAIIYDCRNIPDIKL